MYTIPMTLIDVLPLARNLDASDRRILADEMLQSLEGSEPIDDRILDLVQQRTEYIRKHPEEAIPWAEFKAAMDDRLGPIPA